MTPRLRDLGLFAWLRWMVFGPPNCEQFLRVRGIGYVCGNMSETDCRGGRCDTHCQILCSDGCRRAYNRRLGTEALSKALAKGIRVHD